MLGSIIVAVLNDLQCNSMHVPCLATCMGLLVFLEALKIIIIIIIIVIIIIIIITITITIIIISSAPTLHAFSQSKSSIHGLPSRTSLGNCCLALYATEI